RRVTAPTVRRSVTLLPALSGDPQEASDLSTTDGYWLGWARVQSYQWQRCDASGANCADIPGETDTTYTLTQADVGNTVRSVVTTSNAVGTTSAASQTTSLIQALVLPASISAPVATGSAVDATTLSVSNAGCRGYPSPFHYQR